MRFWIYVFIKLDNFLFKAFVLCFLPFFCLLEDIKALIRYYFVLFIYKRSLYIFSNGKYGRGYFLNNVLSTWHSIKGLDENLFIL